MRPYILLLAAIGLAGCGSIARGTSENVAINATPSGASIQTSNGFKCDTTCNIKVSRKDDFTVTAAYPGYQSETVQVKRKVSGGGAAGMAGNILLGGVIGIGVDAATGAALDHYPNPVNINLEKVGTKQILVVTDPVVKTSTSKKQVPTS